MKYLFEKLKIEDIPFEYKVTKFTGHAVKIAKLFAEKGVQNFMVLGGDGTISEVVNGIFSADLEQTSSLKIALIPRGTGNDWGRFWNLTSDYNHSVDVFLTGKTQLIDIGKIEYVLEGEHQTRFFINSVGLGLDAAVVNITSLLKRYLGSHSFLYKLALLGAVFNYRAHGVTIRSVERNIDEKMFTMNVANGCFSGGGLKQTPFALPYDGLLDVMLAKKPTFFDIISGLRILFKGKLLEHPVIESFQTKKLIIRCHKKALIEADGIIVNGSSPYAMSIIPKAIQMIVP